MKDQSIIIENNQKVAYPANVSIKELVQLKAARVKSEIQVLDKLMEIDQKISDLVEEHKTEIRKIIGDKAFQQISSFKKAIQQKKKRLLHPKNKSVVQPIHPEITKIHQGALEDVKRILKSNNIDIALLQKAQSILRNSSLNLINVFLGVSMNTQEVKWEELTQKKLRPPYTFIGGYNHGRGYGGSNSPFGRDDNRQFLVPQGGIDNMEQLYVINAGNRDFGWIYDFQAYNTSYLMPTTARLKVKVRIKAGVNYQQIGFEDEIGISNAWVLQKHGIQVSFYAANARAEDNPLQILSIAHENTDFDFLPSPFAQTPAFEQGALRELTFFSHSVFRAGTTVGIDFGIVNHNTCFANDVSVNSKMRFSWIFEEVCIDVE